MMKGLQVGGFLISDGPPGAANHPKIECPAMARAGSVRVGLT